MPMSDEDATKLIAEVKRLRADLTSMKTTLGRLTGEVPLNMLLAWVAACTKDSTFASLKASGSLELRAEAYDHIAQVGRDAASSLGLQGSLFDHVAAAFADLRGEDWPDSCPTPSFVQSIYTKAK